MTETTEEFNLQASINELYPQLSSAQREEVEYYLNRYLDLIERVYERTKDGNFEKFDGNPFKR